MFLYGVKVLILHQYFNTPETGGSLRSYYLARALVDRGIRPVVITTHNGDGFRIEDVEGIEVHYLPIPYRNSFGFIKRILSFLKFVFSIVREAGKFKEYEVCYAISTPLTIGLAAIWIKWRYKIPYIFEVGDLWPEAPIQVGIIKNPILKKILYQLERSIYTRAKSIVALSEPIRQAIESKVPGKRIDVIPNMADVEFYKPGTKDPVLEEKFNVTGKFVVSYIGTFGLANGLERMLHYAQEAQQGNLPIHFLLCGEGARHDELQQYTGQLGLQNTSIVPMQNRKGVQEVLNVTDAAFISYLPLPVLETGSPNKYFDALAAGKLIVVNFKGWIRDEIESHACGLFVDPVKPDDFIKLKEILLNQNLLHTFQMNSRALAEKRYSRSKVCEEWVKIIAG